MGIGDKKSDSMQPTIFEFTQEFPPMNLMLRQLYRNAQYLTVTAQVNPDGNQHGNGNDNPAMPNLLI